MKKENKQLEMIAKSSYRNEGSVIIRFKYHDRTTICFISEEYPWLTEEQHLSKGVAICQKDDIYDRQFGEQIAFDKALVKFRTKCLFNYSNEFLFASRILNNKCENAIKKFRKVSKKRYGEK